MPPNLEGGPASRDRTRFKSTRAAASEEATAREVKGRGLDNLPRLLAYFRADSEVLNDSVAMKVAPHTSRVPTKPHWFGALV